jgi:hypothetical protein
MYKLYWRSGFCVFQPQLIACNAQTAEAVYSGLMVFASWLRTEGVMVKKIEECTIGIVGLGLMGRACQRQTRNSLRIWRAPTERVAVCAFVTAVCRSLRRRERCDLLRKPR